MADVHDEFERFTLPHLDSAYNYARWLTGSPNEAEDVVQEAYLRALRYFRSFDRTDARAWLLAIVRNTFHSRWRATKFVPLDPGRHDVPTPSPTPEAELIRDSDREAVRAAVQTLPADFREVLVLREFEGMTYKEIAGVVGIPVGTVMSRLARARDRVADALRPQEAGADHAVR